VAAPAAGLGSNSNYFLYNCDSILGLSVTINVTEEIVGTDGFSFQLNAYSAAGDFDGAQQYCIALNPDGQLYAVVDNWQTGSYRMVDDQGNTAGNVTTVLTSLDVHGTSNPVTTADLDPSSPSSWTSSIGRTAGPPRCPPAPARSRTRRCRR
jgi:hypothetical protein